MSGESSVTIMQKDWIKIYDTVGSRKLPQKIPLNRSTQQKQTEFLINAFPLPWIFLHFFIHFPSFPSFGSKIYMDVWAKVTSHFGKIWQEALFSQTLIHLTLSCKDPSLFQSDKLYQQCVFWSSHSLLLLERAKLWNFF